MLKNLFIIVVLCMSVKCMGLDLTELYLEHNYSIGTNRHWAIPAGERKVGELNLGMKHESSKLYSEYIVRTMYTNTQFRYGALEYEFGLKLSDVSVYLNHISEHVLDRTTIEKYQNQNSLGVRINLK